MNEARAIFLSYIFNFSDSLSIIKGVYRSKEDFIIKENRKQLKNESENLFVNQYSKNIMLSIESLLVVRSIKTNELFEDLHV